MKIYLVVSLFLAAIPFLMNCKKESSPEQMIYNPTPHELIIPPGFPYMIIPDENPATIEGIH